MAAMPVADADIDRLTDKELLELADNLRAGVPMATPVFDGAARRGNQGLASTWLICQIVASFTLYDGRTGDHSCVRSPSATCTCSSLTTLVDDKMHARSTGSYSLGDAAAAGW